MPLGTTSLSAVWLDGALLRPGIVGHMRQIGSHPIFPATTVMAPTDQEHHAAMLAGAVSLSSAFPQWWLPDLGDQTNTWGPLP